MPDHRYDSADTAEDAYYRAFERADLDAMRKVWEAGKDIECVHPMGPLLRGDAVIASWAEMFATPQYVAIQRSNIQRHLSDDLVIHVLQEEILFRDGRQQPLHFIATNVYRRTVDGWRMIAHHASPAPQQPRHEQGSTALH